MKRFQLFEFCDQAWLPSIVHEAFHDCLGFIQRIYRPFYGGTKLILEHSTKLSTGGAMCIS